MNTLLYYISSPSWDIIANEAPFLLMKKSLHPSKKIRKDSLECGAEKISIDKLHFIASNGELLTDVDTRDSVVKHGGKYTIRINKNKQYGFTYNNPNIKSGDILKITVWKYPAYSDTGSLVVTSGKDFYKSIFAGTEKDSAGWVKLTIYATVPKDKSDLKVYTWNATAASVWFDDLKIVRYSIN
jgi:hypothetical protein